LKYYPTYKTFGDYFISWCLKKKSKKVNPILYNRKKIPLINFIERFHEVKKENNLVITSNKLNNTAKSKKINFEYSRYTKHIHKIDQINEQIF